MLRQDEDLEIIFSNRGSALVCRRVAESQSRELGHIGHR